MKVAIVTGAASGIGLSVVSELLKNQWHVTLNDLKDASEAEESLKQLQKEQRDHQWPQEHMVYHQADITRPEQARNLIHETHQRWGRVDLLVNNAGIQCVASVEDHTIDMWHQVMDLNLSACFYTSRVAIPLMKAQQFGRIINLGSVHSMIGLKHKGAYTASKHALLGLTKAIALETSGTGITCNAICPGAVLTPGWLLSVLKNQSVIERAEQENLSFIQARDALIKEKQPTHKFIRPQDIAQMVLFMASPASQNMTGMAFTIDGGWTTQ